MEAELYELLLDMREHLLLVFREFGKFWEQQFLAVLRGAVFQAVQGLFVQNARVGGMLVYNQEPFGVFARDVGVRNLEQGRGRPGSLLLGGRRDVALVGLQRNDLARLGLGEEVLDFFSLGNAGLCRRESCRCLAHSHGGRRRKLVAESGVQARAEASVAQVDERGVLLEFLLERFSDGMRHHEEHEALVRKADLALGGVDVHVEFGVGHVQEQHGNGLALGAVGLVCLRNGLGDRLALDGAVAHEQVLVVALAVGLRRGGYVAGDVNA